MLANTKPSSLRRLFAGFTGKRAQSTAAATQPAATHRPHHPVADHATPDRAITRSNSPDPGGTIPGIEDRAGFDVEVFERTAAYLAADVVIAYMRELAARTDALLRELNSNVPTATAERAAQAHKLAGSAGMFGFHTLSTVARQYERALENAADDRAALADALQSALVAALPEMQQRSIG